jgi:hypothetical protein
VVTDGTLVWGLAAAGCGIVARLGIDALRRVLR